MDRAMLYDRIFGCWLGKNIGGTLGAPLEGHKNPAPLPLRFPSKNEPNDDLDLQLVWLDMLNRKGVNLTDRDFADCWINNITYPFDEYGVANANIRRGLMPPQTGIFNNFFLDCMGSPIRSEIWGCICAGMPETAAYYARLDAQVDHYNEGVYGEILFSCMEASAFTGADIISITETGLSFLPDCSEVKQSVELTLKGYREGMPLEELRGILVARYDRGNFSHCILNIAFTIAGLLYGETDFLKSMVMAVNLGYDTDCTGATAGAIVGIMRGYKAIQEQYKVEMDTRILAGWGVKDIKVPADIGEMTEQTIALHEKLLACAERPSLPRNFLLPYVPAANIKLQREFLVSNRFDTVEQANAALAKGEGFIKVTYNSDTIDLAPFIVDAKPLFISTTVRLPRPGKYRLVPTGDQPMRFWIDGQDMWETNVVPHAPSPHRHGNPKAAVYAGTEVRVMVRIDHRGVPAKFALLTSDERNFHIIEAAYHA